MYTLTCGTHVSVSPMRIQRAKKTQKSHAETGTAGKFEFSAVFAGRAALRRRRKKRDSKSTNGGVAFFIGGQSEGANRDVTRCASAARARIYKMVDRSFLAVENLRDERSVGFGWFFGEVGLWVGGCV